jgi:hypothetical protein
MADSIDDDVRPKREELVEAWNEWKSKVIDLSIRLTLQGDVGCG